MQEMAAIVDRKMSMIRPISQWQEILKLNRL
jgi:hypothetical protein